MTHTNSLISQEQGLHLIPGLWSKSSLATYIGRFRDPGCGWKTSSRNWNYSAACQNICQYINCERWRLIAKRRRMISESFAPKKSLSLCLACWRMGRGSPIECGTDWRWSNPLFPPPPLTADNLPLSLAQPLNWGERTMHCIECKDDSRMY